MFNIKTSQGDKIKSIFEILKPYIEKCNLHITKNGIGISTSDDDPLELSQTLVRLDANNFDVFECTESTLVGIDTKYFWKIIKNVTRVDTLTFRMDDNDNYKWDVVLQDGTREVSYTLTSLNLPKLQPFDLNQYEPQLLVTFPASILNNIIKEVHNLEGKNLQVTCDDDTLTFSCVADPINIVSSVHKGASKVTFTNYQKDLLFVSDYPITKLINLTKGTHVSKTVSVAICDQGTIVFHYEISGLGTMKFYLHSFLPV